MTLPIGEWQWSGDKQTLALSAGSDKPFHVLNGVWSLPDLGMILDGLSRQRLLRAFDSSENVACQLMLASDDAFELVGGFTEDGGARGFILPRQNRRRDRSEPGPQLVPVFQPIVSLTTAEIVGFEALARWPDGTVEHMANSLEDEALASNMLIHACSALSDWSKMPGRSKLFVQVNLTSRDLANESLVPLIRALVTGYELDERRLRLELTEQAALRDAGRALEVAKELRDAGAGLVLDDFGSGHSSFLWLADLPADGLKVDADMIAGLTRPRVETILEAISALAERLGMTSTAEGVESPAIIPKLRALGFDYAQGFALARPMQAENAKRLLEESNRFF